MTATVVLTGAAAESLEASATQEISKHQWIAFLAQFTRENRVAHARLEVLGAEVGRVVETGDRPFDGIPADVKDGESSIWIAFGAYPDDHLDHGVQQVTKIWLRPATEKAGAALEIDARDGTKTLLELSRPEDYALPPAESVQP